MANLFEIKKEYQDILNKVYEEEGEITPELAELFKINEGDFKEKAINYGRYIQSLENDNLIIETEIKRLKAIKDKNSDKIEKLELVIVDAMGLFSTDKIESPILKLSLRKSEAVVVNDESKLSDNFFTTKLTKTVSKTALKDAIKNGAEIDGAALVTNINLRIK